MAMRMNRIVGLALFSALVPNTIFSAGPAYALTPVEKLYAELAKLPDEERHKRIVAGARKEGIVVLINTTSGKKGVTHLRVFKKRYPKIKSERGETSVEKASETIIAETRAGRHISDGLSLSLSDMGEVLKNNIAARYPTPAIKKILPEYRGANDPQNRWVTYKINEQGISYNPVMLKTLNIAAPTSRMDLCHRRFKGLVSFDTEAIRVLSGLHAIMGEEKLKEYLECMGKNEPIIMRGLTVRTMLMMAGDHAIQGSNTLYRGVALHKKNPKKAPFKVLYEAPIMIYPTAMLINSHAPYPYAAALFVDWNLSKESQSQITGWGRGNATEKHPFFPTNAKLVVFGLLDKPTRERLRGYWVKHILRRK